MGPTSLYATQNGKECALVTLLVLYSYDNKIEHYRIRHWDNKYTTDDEEIFENLTQLVEHFRKDADGLVTRLRVPVENKSGKVEYSVDSEDFKKSTSGGGDGGLFVLGTDGYLMGQVQEGRSV